MLQYGYDDLKKQNQRLLAELEKLSKQNNTKGEIKKLHKEIIKLKQELKEERLLNGSLNENAEKAINDAKSYQSGCMILQSENNLLNERLKSLENENEISKRDLKTVQGLLEMVARSRSKKKGILIMIKKKRILTNQL